MTDYEWVIELLRRAKESEWYQLFVRDVQASEPDYIDALATLPPYRREQVERYLSDCIQQESALTLLAYTLGLEHGKNYRPERV